MPISGIIADPSTPGVLSGFFVGFLVSDFARTKKPSIQLGNAILVADWATCFRLVS